MPKKNQGRAANPRLKKKPTKKSKPKAEATKEDVSLERVALPNVLAIAYSSWLLVWKHRKAFSFIILIYGLAYLVLVLGLSSPANSSGLKSEFTNVLHGHLHSFYSGFSIFTYLVGSSTTTSTAGGSAYQVFILIVASLSIIWTLRQFYAGTKVRARDGYYKGMYPLVQYILLILFIAIELIPLAIGVGLYTVLISNGIAITAIEKYIAAIIAIGLSGLSFYFVTSSVIALYIVTLPDMTPLKALRSAKGLVKGRRWTVFRKILFLPVLLFVVAGVIMLPFILIVPGFSAWLFFILSLIGLVYIHSYLYNLYRGLINEQSTS